MLFRPLLHLNSSRALTTGLICLSSLSSLPRTTLAPFSSSCLVAMSQPATPEWLQEHLSTLLASPYIHFNQPKFPGALHLRMGPGPIDLFSTRFANMFTKEATGVVAGVQVDKEGLKESLLALQKQWNSQTAQFVAAEPTSSEFQAATKFTWTPKEAAADASLTVTASASVNEDEGLQKIASLVLDGDAALFQPAQTSTTV